MKTAGMLLSLVCLMLIPYGPLGANDAPPGVEKARSNLAKDPEVKAVDDDAAKGLLKAVKEAEKGDDEATTVKAIDALVTARHEDFVKPLEKLARNRSVAIRIIAVKALGSQEPAKKIGPKLFALLKWKPNESSPQTLSMVISSLRRLKYEHPSVDKELEGEFKKVVDPVVMEACVRYFGDLGKKDAVGLLMGWVEAPHPENPNSPTNPPAAYWQRLNGVWQVIKDAVRVALYDITGMDFATQHEWAEWLETRDAKEKGFK